ncbi:MAG: hypothetical protein IT310_15170 [Anaerolineales bacterium]|nr:hypothetical protein [Anaerolineales bacterium]
MKKYISPVATLFPLFTLPLLWIYPAVVPTLGVAALVFSLAFSIYAIFQKHKGTENHRPKVLKEVVVMVLTLVIVIFIGGIAAMLANYQVRIRWGENAGIISAIVASFMVGYLVRKGVLKLAG